MKIALFSLSLILSLIYPNSFLYAAAQASSSPVVDSNGDNLEPGVLYYIAFSGIGFRGGIGLPEGSTSKCPANVIEMPGETERGIPVLVQPVMPTDSSILENSTNVYITFSGTVTACPLELGNAFWRVAFQPLLRGFAVVAGEVFPDNPVSNFKIARSGGFPRSYKFVTCALSNRPCLNLGISRDILGNLRLVVNSAASETPYRFWFIKADSAQVVPK